MKNYKLTIRSIITNLWLVPLFLIALPTLAAEKNFVPKGAGADYFETMREAFDISILGDMLHNFYVAMRDEESVFQYLMAVGDGLLAPILGPLIIVCAGSRLIQDMKDPNSDVFAVIYATGAVVLIIALYRLAMAELVLVTNALTISINPVGYSFENTMSQIEDTVQLFNQSKKNRDPIALLVDKSLSLYTEYFMAWGSKWGVMVMHGLLNYLRSTLFALNYVLGIFLLPFMIIKQNRLPRNWLMITAFIFLWGIVEAVMIAVMGNLGSAALKASLDVPGALPIFSESLFYVMVTTVNILIGVAMLSSVWIVKSYLLSPAAISGAAALFSLPAVSLAVMSSAMGYRGSIAATGAARATLSSKNKKGASGSTRSLPMPSDIFGGGTKSSGRNKKPSTSNPSSPSAPAGGDASKDTGGSTASLKRPYRMRSIIEHNGKLDKSILPSGVTAISRVGKKHKVK